MKMVPALMVSESGNSVVSGFPHAECNPGLCLLGTHHGFVWRDGVRAGVGGSGT